MATKYFKLGGTRLRTLHKNLILSDIQSNVQRNPEGKLYSLAPIEYFRILHQQIDVILSYGAKVSAGNIYSIAVHDSTAVCLLFTVLADAFRRMHKDVATRYSGLSHRSP